MVRADPGGVGRRPDDTLRALCDLIEDGAVLCTEDGTVDWLNVPGRVMLGDEALGHNVCDVLHPEDSAGGLLALRDRVAREGEFSYPARAHGPGGGQADVMVHLRMAPLPGELGKAMLLAVFHERTAAGAEGAGSLAPERQLEIAVPANQAALVALISRYLLNLSFDQVERGIERALAAVGRSAGCGRSYLFLLSADGRGIERVWEWTARDVRPHDLRALVGTPMSRFPWSLKFFLANREVAVVDGNVLPREATAERISCETLNIRAYLNVPILLRGRLVGWIGLDAVEGPRIWSAAEVSMLRSVGGLVSSAIFGADQEKELVRERSRADLILACVGEAVVCADASGRVSFINPSAERLTGWDREEAVGRALSEVVVLRPDDRPEERLDPLTVVTAGQDLVLRDRAAREVPVLVTVAGLEDGGGGRVLALRDVTEVRRAAQEVRHHASHDPLTGLVNRREFEVRLARAAQAAGERGLEHALCFLDLDHFKHINDTAGHAAGDAALREVSRLIRGNIRSRDTLARIGGDEFGLLLEDCSADDAYAICRGLVDALGGFRFQWSGDRFPVGVSIGMTRVTGPGEPLELLTEADRACLRAKYRGRGRVELYDPQQEITALSMRQRLTATALREAVDNGALTLTWQRVMPLPDTDGPPLYAEVQSHLPRSDGGLMPAELFLPVARRHGLMARLDRRVMQRATDAWMRLGRPLPLALNLSRETLCDAGIVDGVRGLITARGIQPGELWFEIRESAWEARLAEARAVATQLAELGCRLVLDDCSGSFACLDHLEKGRFSALKIDVRKLGPLRANGSGVAMFKALIAAAHGLGVVVVAQKLPDRGVLPMLAAIGVDGVQARVVAPPELLVGP